MTETQGLIAALLLTITVFLYTFWPERTAFGQKAKSRLDYLLERKEQLNESLRDLTFEYSAGKYTQEDYSAQLESVKREATELQSEIDRQPRA
jgi:hypothetical protein